MPTQPKDDQAPASGKQSTNTRSEDAHSGPESAPEGARSEPPGGWGGSNPPDPRFRWKKGQSGNPKGRPKGRTLADRLANKLDANDGELAEMLVKVLIREAGKGKFQHMREIFDRIDGRVTEKREITGAEGGPIEIGDAKQSLLDKLAHIAESEGETSGGAE